MIPLDNHDQAKVLFVDAVEAMIDRIREVEERFKNDPEGLNHHTIREIQHWFREMGKVNRHF